MRKSFIIFFLVLLIGILNGCHVSAISIGTAPGVYDLGEVKPGKDYAFKFYLITNSPSDMLVSLGYIPAHFDIYTKNNTGGYTFLQKEASQEDISKWVEIPMSTVLLSPTKVKIITLESGGVVKANEEVDVILHVPENAEPGYHAGGINLAPHLPSGGRGTGVSTIGITRFLFVFRVIGDAIREGEIISVVAERVEEKRVRFGVIFKNTGTTTITAKIEYLKIYDKFGNLTATISSGYQKVSPGKTIILPVYWSGKDVEPGAHRVEAKVSYITGHARFEGRVEIPEKIIRVVKKPIVKKEISVCVYSFLWIILLLIIGVVVYLKFQDYREVGLGISTIGIIYVLFFSNGFSCILTLPLIEIFFILVIIILIFYYIEK